MSKTSFKEWFEWHFGTPITSKKSILTMFIVIGAASIAFYFVFVKPDSRSSLEKELPNTTIGHVTNVEPVEQMSQTQTGSRINTIGYYVHYEYSIGKKTVQRKEYILSNTRNAPLIMHIKRNIGTNNFTVKYSEEAPQGSIILMPKTSKNNG